MYKKSFTSLKYYFWWVWPDMLKLPGQVWNILVTSY